MARRLDPLHKKPADSLADLRAGVREAAIAGPKSALKFLERLYASQHSLPNGVKFFFWDLMAEYTFQTGDSERCERAVVEALARWDDAQEQFAVELKNARPELTFLERGIATRSDAGDFAGALALCDFAVANGFGKHYEAKRESLEWAR
jgi:hypothetical protein